MLENEKYQTSLNLIVSKIILIILKYGEKKTLAEYR